MRGWWTVVARMMSIFQLALTSQLTPKFGDIIEVNNLAMNGPRSKIRLANHKESYIKEELPYLALWGVSVPNNMVPQAQ